MIADIAARLGIKESLIEADEKGLQFITEKSQQRWQEASKADNTFLCNNPERLRGVASDMGPISCGDDLAHFLPERGWPVQWTQHRRRC